MASKGRWNRRPAAGHQFNPECSKLRTMPVIDLIGPYYGLVTSWVAHLFLGFVFGSVIGLALWLRRRRDLRGNPAGSMLRWSGLVIGIYFLRGVFDLLLFMFYLYWAWLVASPRGAIPSVLDMGLV